MRELWALTPDADPKDQVLDVIAQLSPRERTIWEMQNEDWQRKLDEIFREPGS